jgi:ribosomal protein L11 methyltransferase
MAFGTGSHPTTQLCLAALEDFVHAHARVADIGAGSGILAIAARKLGAATVDACDIDPIAVRIAADNARANLVEIAVGSHFPTGPFDIIVANILADTILGLVDEFRAHLAPDGLLVASGIIEERADDVANGLSKSGLALVETRRSGDWVAQIYRRN